MKNTSHKARLGLLALILGVAAIVGVTAARSTPSKAWPIQTICWQGQLYDFSGQTEGEFLDFLATHDGAFVGVCGPSTSVPEQTAPPTTVAPTTTETPTTVAPTTEAPTTEAPTTEVPTTEVPTTVARNPRYRIGVSCVAGANAYANGQPDGTTLDMTYGGQHASATVDENGDATLHLDTSDVYSETAYRIVLSVPGQTDDVREGKVRQCDASEVPPTAPPVTERVTTPPNDTVTDDTWVQPEDTCIEIGPDGIGHGAFHFQPCGPGLATDTPESSDSTDSTTTTLSSSLPSTGLATNVELGLVAGLLAIGTTLVLVARRRNAQREV